MKPYDASDWYWVVGGNTAQVYSSKPAVRNFVPVADADYVAWLASDGEPTQIDTEANLGAVLAPYMLRPIPPGILAGYLDEQKKQIVIQPQFKLWLDVYAEVLNPTPSEAEIHARVRGLL